MSRCAVGVTETGVELPYSTPRKLAEVPAWTRQNSEIIRGFQRPEKIFAPPAIKILLPRSWSAGSVPEHARRVGRKGYKRK